MLSGNMVPDTLFLYCDLVMSVTVDSDLMLWIHSSQEVAIGELLLLSKQFADHGEHGFCARTVLFVVIIKGVVLYLSLRIRIFVRSYYICIMTCH